MQPIDITDEFLSTLFDGTNKKSLYTLIKRRAQPIEYFGHYQAELARSFFVLSDEGCLVHHRLHKMP